VKYCDNDGVTFLVPNIIKDNVASLTVSGLREAEAAVSFCFCCTGVLAQGFALAWQTLYHLSHASSSFYSGYFWR
jgi:hypothetical protein